MYDLEPDSNSTQTKFFDPNVTQGQASKYGSKFHLQPTIRSILPPKDYMIDDTRNDFVKHAMKWKRETIHISSPSEKYLHPSYARIIGMGRKALPFLFLELQNHGGDWFYALRAITGANPVTPSMAGNMPKMISAWLTWRENSR